MPFLTTAALLTLLFSAPGQKVVLPTSELVKFASVAALDDGYDLSAPGVFLDELKTADHHDPLPGYSSIALYVNDHIVHTYAVRVSTLDVVDNTECRILRYPDLVVLKEKLAVKTSVSPVNLDALASEVGCDSLKSVNKPTLNHPRRSH